MESFSSAPAPAQSEHASPDRAVYVEDLSSAEDYWLSITDASRICRVQDVSIRRAIARGALPVRRQRAGQNKRTRFVRASDLSTAGFPIIDESAAITTEIGKADILSIPRQQQRILQEHQQLVTALDELQTRITAQQEQVRTDLRQQRETSQALLQQQAQKYEQKLAAMEAHLKQEYEQKLAAMEAHLKQELEQWRQTLNESDQRLSHDQHALHQELKQLQQEALQREKHTSEMLQKQKNEFVAQQDQVRQTLQELATTQQQTLQIYQHTLEEQIQQVQAKTEQRLAALSQEIAQKFEYYVNLWQEHLDALEAAFLASQQHTEQFERETAIREQELESALQAQRSQLEQLSQLLPLLPYLQHRLLTEQDLALWTRQLLELEKRLTALSLQEHERYLPLLTLLSPEYMARLGRLLQQTDIQDQ